MLHPLNLRMVQAIDPAATGLLAGTRRELRGLGKLLIFSEASTWWQLLIDAGIEREAIFTDDDFALEYGENLLLAERFRDVAWEAQTPLEKCALFTGFDFEELAVLEPLLATRSYQRGQTIVAAGQSSDELFVITRGSAMVSVPTQNGVSRLNSFTSGMTFGDIAFIDRSPRSANVTALGRVECRVLTREAFTRLDLEAPVVKIRLLQNLAHGMSSMLRHLSRELAALK